MASRTTPPAVPPKPSKPTRAREADLAAALRENLRRRKAQAQARAAEQSVRSDVPDKDGA